MLIELPYPKILSIAFSSKRQTIKEKGDEQSSTINGSEQAHDQATNVTFRTQLIGIRTTVLRQFHFVPTESHSLPRIGDGIVRLERQSVDIFAQFAFEFLRQLSPIDVARSRVSQRVSELIDVSDGDADGSGSAGRMERLVDREYLLAAPQISVDEFHGQRDCVLYAVKIEQQFQQLGRVSLLVDDEEAVGKLNCRVGENFAENHPKTFRVRGSF